MGGFLVILALGAIALAAGGASSRRRGTVTEQTRARVRDTLADRDPAALPVEPAPARVDPDRAAAAAPDMSFELDAAGRAPHEAGYGGPAADAAARTRARGRSGVGDGVSSTGAPSGSSSAWARSRGTIETRPSEDMSFELDAAGRAPHEPGYVEPGRSTPSGSAAALIVTPPDPDDARPEGGGSSAAPITPSDPTEARALAGGTATSIRTSASGWRNRLIAFQRAAGITPDGLYGGLSYNALIYYGVRNPPAARSNPRPSAASSNYRARVSAGAR